MTTERQHTPRTNREMPNTTTMKELPRGSEIIIGALAPPLHQQLGVDLEATQAHQKDVDALNRLRIRGLISRAQAGIAERKIIRSLGQALRETHSGESG